MRELTSHKANGLNEQITIQVLDEPGPGGASHVYGIAAADPVTENIEQTAIKFQKGPISESGVNGISIEALLAIVEDRLKGFQSGEHACLENQIALSRVQDAILMLHFRTRERLLREVEGTSAK